MDSGSAQNVHHRDEEWPNYDNPRNIFENATWRLPVADFIEMVKDVTTNVEKTGMKAAVVNWNLPSHATGEAFHLKGFITPGQ